MFSAFCRKEEAFSGYILTRATFPQSWESAMLMTDSLIAYCSTETAEDPICASVHCNSTLRTPIQNACVLSMFQEEIYAFVTDNNRPGVRPSRIVLRDLWLSKTGSLHWLIRPVQVLCGYQRKAYKRHLFKLDAPSPGQRFKVNNEQQQRCLTCPRGYKGDHHPKLYKLCRSGCPYLRRWLVDLTSSYILRLHFCNSYFNR